MCIVFIWGTSLICITCIMSDSHHECLIKKYPLITLSAGDAQMGASNEMFRDNSDHHNIKKGVCRVSKFVNNS